MLRTRLLFVCLVVPYAFLVRALAFVCDDAYITFRYARNIARGAGARYNLGESPPVEGYCNFLWMLVCAALEAAHLATPRWSLLVSFACALVLLWRLVRLLTTEHALSTGAVFGAGLLCVLHPPFAAYATSGLETMLYTLILFLAGERLLLSKTVRVDGWTALALIGLFLVRTEGAAWMLVFVALAALRLVFLQPDRQLLIRLAKCTLVVLAVFGVYWSWRWNYYGLPWPNTVYAKTGHSAAHFARGARYVASHAVTFGLPLALVPLAGWVLLRRRHDAVALAALAVPVGFACYSVLVGGDFMAMGRFLVPAWPFATVLFALALDAAIRRLPRRELALSLGAAVLALVGMLPAFGVEFAPASWQARLDFRSQPGEGARVLNEAEVLAFQKNNAWKWSAIGRALAWWFDEDITVVRATIGAVGYYADCHLLDCNGLVTREVTIRPPKEKLGAPSHDRAVPPEFFLPHEPDVLRAAVVSGFPLLDVLGERGARERFVAGLDLLIGAPLRRHGATDRYVPDFLPVPPGDPIGDDHFLVLARRVPAGTSSAAAWEAFEARCAAWIDGSLRRADFDLARH